MADPPAYRRDAHGRPLDAYPDPTEYGRPLGINALGTVAYATDGSVTLASLDEDGDIRVPVRERRLARSFPLAEADLTTAEYVLYVADEVGPWRALSPLGRERVTDHGVAPERVLADDPFDADPTELLTSLRDPEGVESAAEASGALRQFAMDRPDATVELVGELLALLGDGVLGTSGPELDAETGRAAGFQRLAVRADLVFAVARATREDSAAVAGHLDALLDALGEDREPAGENPPLFYLTDALDVLGRADTDGLATALAERIRTPERAVPTLNALYRLEHRYASDDHPLLEDSTLREAVRGAREHAGEVGAAAGDVETIHGFHRNTRG